MIQNVVISLMHIKDYKKINELFVELHQGHVIGRPDIYVSSQTPILYDELNQIIRSKQYVSVVAKFEDEIIGFAIAQIKLPIKNDLLRGNRIVYIEEICVSTAFRKKGVGKRLYEYIENFAKEREIDRIDLNVWSFNKAYHAAMNFSMLALSVKPEFELTFYQLGFDVILHIGVVISVHAGEVADKSGVSVKNSLHGCRVTLARLDNGFIGEKSMSVRIVR